MQNVDHADVSCLHYFFHKRGWEGEEKGKENIGGGICLWLVWLQVFVEKWIDDDDDDDGGDFHGDDVDDDDDVDDRQSPSFFFVVLVHVHVPFGHLGMIGCIDDDMNNEHVHFFVFPSFFPVLSVPTLGTRYLPRGIPPR